MAWSRNGTSVLSMLKFVKNPIIINFDYIRAKYLPIQLLGSCLLLQFLVVRQQQEATFWGIRLKICLSTKVSTIKICLLEDFSRKGPLYTLSLPAIQNKFFICTLDILRVHKGPSILDVLLCQYPRNKKKLTGEQSIIWWFSSVYEAFLIFQLRRFFRQFISFE